MSVIIYPFTKHAHDLLEKEIHSDDIYDFGKIVESIEEESSEEFKDIPSDFELFPMKLPRKYLGKYL